MTQFTRNNLSSAPEVLISVIYEIGSLKRNKTT